MTPGTLVILDNPSPEYERWRNECAEVFRNGLPDHFDIKLIGKKDAGLILRVRPLAVRKAVGKVA